MILMKRATILLITFLLLFAAAAGACAEPVTRIRYVFLDYSGEYTGSVDTNSIPFGYGLFVCDAPLTGDPWHYIGMWENGLPEGEGAVYYENGNIEKGTFSKGVLIDGFRFSSAGLSITPVVLERQMPETDEVLYIGNKNSMKFHLPNCRAVSQMKEKNKVEFKTREEAIEHGYKPCGECNP